MRWLALLVCLGGCYKPHYGSPSFYCHPEDVPSCPDGQECVDGRCYAPNDVVLTGADLSSGWNPDDGGSQADLASQAPEDMLSCVANGGHCGHTDSVCCSKWCDYSTGNCVKH